jgi:hypothetical protein
MKMVKAGYYETGVVCTNCGNRDEKFRILVGRKVHDTKCSICGCLTLQRIFSAKGARQAPQEPQQIEMSGLPLPILGKKKKRKSPQPSDGPRNPPHHLTTVDEMNIVQDYQNGVKIRVICARYKTSSGKIFTPPNGVLPRHGISLNRAHGQVNSKLRLK